MPVKNKHKQFEDHTVQSWPEILDDLHIESIPTDYVKQIKVTFIDGKVWLIDVNESYSNYDDLDLALEELYAQHEDVIETINFNRIYEERQNFDPVGHYSRPDVTKLIVNRERQSTVNYIS